MVAGQSDGLNSAAVGKTALLKLLVEAKVILTEDRMWLGLWWPFYL